MSRRADIANDEVAEPHGSEEAKSLQVKVDQEQGERSDSEADLEEEKGKVASDQVDVSDEGRLVLELADVDVEEVDGEGRRQDVGDREDEGQDWDVCQESHVVTMPEFINVRKISAAQGSQVEEISISNESRLKSSL